MIVVSCLEKENLYSSCFAVTLGFLDQRIPAVSQINLVFCCSINVYGARTRNKTCFRGFEHNGGQHCKPPHFGESPVYWEKAITNKDISERDEGREDNKMRASTPMI